MKGHLFFNTWCGASMLAELLANVETETDVIIVDRGILDVLVWLTSQERRGEVTDQEARIIESFFLLERWRSLIDLGVVMSVPAEEALRRENSARISSKPGSVMNPEALTAVTESVSTAVDRYGPKFPKVIRHDTAGKDIKDSLVNLADQIIASFEHFLNPDVLVVPRQRLETLPLANGGAFGPEAIKQAVNLVEAHGQFMPRERAEDNFDYVQVIACGMLEHNKRVFVFQRRDTDPKYRLYGKATILQGCHISNRENQSIRTRLETALLEKLSRTLFLSRTLPSEPIGYCWDKDDDISGRHLGIVHRVKIDNPHTASDLQKKEFRKKRGHGIAGQFYDLKDLTKDDVSKMLETWSHAIMRGMGIEK